MRMNRLKTSDGTPKPETWPMWRGPLAYGHATAVKMRWVMATSLSAGKTRHADVSEVPGPGGIPVSNKDVADQPSIDTAERPIDRSAELAVGSALVDLPPIPQRPVRRRVGPRSRRPIVGLISLVAFGLVAAFFGWASADPFWLAVGKGADGTVTVAECSSAAHCTGRFTGADKSFTVSSVSLSGLPEDQRAKGHTSPAWMLNETRTWAYAGPGWALHLRWLLGLAIALLCGVAIAATTGTRHLRPHGRRAVVAGRLLAMLAPLLLFAGMVAAALFV
jgi:hypothetical protein